MNIVVSRMRRHLHYLVGITLALTFLTTAKSGRADTFSSYQDEGSFSLPSSAALFDTLPNGRIMAIVQATIYEETAAGSRSFATLGTLAGADIPSFGPAFIRTSPDGTKIAVGNNGGSSFNNFQVGVFAIAALSGSWFSANHFDAGWIDNRYLALTAGSTSSSTSIVTALDTSSANPASPVNTTLVNNIGGASGGVAFDGAGNLYTADGFQFGGPSGTGAVYAVKSSAWHAALAGGSPVNFEAAGTPIIDLLSGSSLAFDAAGNLLVGGGNSFSSPPDDNYFALVDVSAVATALAGGGLINTSDTTKVRKLDPDPGAGSTYEVGANRARGEFYALPSGSATTYVFQPAAVASVPAVPVWGIAMIAASLAMVGTRRRTWDAVADRAV